MEFVKHGKENCPHCKAMKESIIEEAFTESYKLLCNNNKELIQTFLNEIEEIIQQESNESSIKRLEEEKQISNENFELMIEKVIIGEKDTNGKVNPRVITFILKSGNEIKCEEDKNQQSSYEVSENCLQEMHDTCGVLLGAISKRLDTIVEFTAFEDFISFEKKGENNIKRVENHKIKVTIEVDMVCGVV